MPDRNAAGEPSRGAEWLHAIDRVVKRAIRLASGAIVALVAWLAERWPHWKARVARSMTEKASSARRVADAAATSASAHGVSARRPFRRLPRPTVAVTAMLALSMATLGGCTWIRCGWQGCPDVGRLRAYQPGRASRLLDRSGREFAELLPVAGSTAPLGMIPKHVRDAFLAVEDKRFYDHGGVDWWRVFGAIRANIRAGGVREGFSTVTMQLARNVFADRLPASERTLVRGGVRKLLEIRVAGEIEETFTKDEILELYLSHIYFGNGARGIEAASHHYFGVPTSRLTLPQGALLAAMVKAPVHYDPRRHPEAARTRRNLVLTLMEAQGRIAQAAAAQARATPVKVFRRHAVSGADAVPRAAPWFVEEARRRAEETFGDALFAESLLIKTTLDLRLQQAAEREMARQLRALDDVAPEIQGAFVALDASTGDVLAWVGGRDFGRSRFDRVKSARRQVGSAFKPFVYAAALRSGRTLSDRIVDEPIAYRSSSARIWEPQNYDARFDGPMSLREALVRSKNIPAVRLGLDVGLGKIEKLSHEAGIAGDMARTPSMPLGTVAVSPLELAAAYTPFASLGRAVTPRVLLEVTEERSGHTWRAPEPESRDVLEPDVAYLITDVLRDVVDRGTGKAVRAAGFSDPAAGKTGTTNDATDTWFVGFTPRVVAVVWFGYDTPRSIGPEATGGRLAAPTWGRIMAAARRSDGAWRRTEGVGEYWVDPETGEVLLEGCRTYDGRAMRELFIRESLDGGVCPEHGDVIAAVDDWGDIPERAIMADWPEEFGGISEAAPPPELEEADEPRRRRSERDRGRWTEERYPEEPGWSRPGKEREELAKRAEEAAKRAEEAAKRVREEEKRAWEEMMKRERESEKRKRGKGKWR